MKQAYKCRILFNNLQTKNVGIKTIKALNRLRDLLILIQILSYDIYGTAILYSLGNVTQD